MNNYKIVETDNFCRDYPGETFLNIPWLQKEQADDIAEVINKYCSGDDRQRYWKVVPVDYILDDERFEG